MAALLPTDAKVQIRHEIRKCLRKKYTNMTKLKLRHKWRVFHHSGRGLAVIALRMRSASPACAPLKGVVMCCHDVKIY